MLTVLTITGTCRSGTVLYVSLATITIQAGCTGMDQSAQRSVLRVNRIGTDTVVFRVKSMIDLGLTGTVRSASRARTIIQVHRTGTGPSA